MELANEKGDFLSPRDPESGCRGQGGKGRVSPPSFPGWNFSPSLVGPAFIHCWKFLKRSKMVEAVLGLNRRFWRQHLYMCPPVWADHGP